MHAHIKYCALRNALLYVLNQPHAFKARKRHRIAFLWTNICSDFRPLSAGAHSKHAVWRMIYNGRLTRDHSSGIEYVHFSHP